MKSFYALLTVACTVSAEQHFLLSRQLSGAFQPVAAQLVTDCKLPCGASDCLDGPRGDVCCSEGYACPGGNFCLTDKYCCPNGLDAQTCASKNNITLPSGFTAGKTMAVTTEIPMTASQLTGSMETPSPTPFYVAENTTSAMATGVMPTSPVKAFTGGASAEKKHGIRSLAVMIAGLFAGILL